MNLPPADRQRIDAICDAALELSMDARAAFVQQQCAGDHEMRTEVESLLAGAARAEAMLEEPVAALAARTMAYDGLPAPLTLSPGTRIGTYEIVSLLGVGGMGEVYRARDSKLGREVALKVVPDALTRQPGQFVRFEREARALAAFSHPNIAQIHGLEESGHVRALVMELVEGEDLARRLLRGPIPFETSVVLLQQIVEALAAAHEKGLVHRDLKPSNIMVTTAGRVKVLDFGLAKGTQSDAAAAPSSPFDSGPSEAGRIVGTAAYMSPEQATGQPIDQRTDVWALGCVMFELLSGARAFRGDTSADTLANVLRVEPDWSRLPATLPASVRRLVRRCLAKDPQARVPDVWVVRYVLEGSTERQAADQLSLSPPRAVWGYSSLSLAIAAASILGLAAVLMWGQRRPADGFSEAREIRTSIPLPSGVELPRAAMMALSPDGSTLVYEGFADGKRLYKRLLSDTESTAIDGTQLTYGPFFSPDGKWLGFAGEGGLQKVPIAGGRPEPIADVKAVAGASWGEDGYIVFGRVGNAGLFRVAASGGVPERVTTPLADEDDHRWPQVLPGGRGVVFSVGNGPGEDSSVVVLDLRTGQQKHLVRGSASSRYVRTGHLVYARNGDLFAQRFDLERLELVGPAVTIARGVEEDTDGHPQYAFSANGDLVYCPGWSGGPRDVLTIVDLNGHAEATSFPPGPIVDQRFSPDGNRIALTLTAAKNNTWIYDLIRRTHARATDGRYHLPVWMPDGRLTMARGPLNHTAVVTRSPVSDGPDAELLATGPQRYPADWTRDGRTLFLEQMGRETNWDIWRLSPDSPEPTPVVATRFPERHPRVSPDGRWLAYLSQESERWEVYVRSLVGRPQRQQVSIDGSRLWGIAWAPDGRRLYYRGHDQGVWVGDVTTSPVLAVGRPVRLFPAAEYDDRFDIAPDGKRFAMVRRGPAEPRQRIQLVVNGLRRQEEAR